jgi:peptidoglycan/LPS O-acetylase OafA/YrhL
MLVLDMEERGRASRLLRAAPLVVFGKYSYAIYVLHHPPLFFLPEWWSVGALTVRFGAWMPAQFVFTTVTSLSALLMAIVSWHLLEKHFLRLKDVLAPHPSLSALGSDHVATLRRGNS